VRPEPNLQVEEIIMVQIEEDVREKVKSLLRELFQFDNQG
jgi:spermidine synthase